MLQCMIPPRAHLGLRRLEKLLAEHIGELSVHKVDTRWLAARSVVHANAPPVHAGAKQVVCSVPEQEG